MCQDHKKNNRRFTSILSPNIKKLGFVLNTFPTGVVGNEKKASKQPDLKCDDLKNRDFYYLTERPQNGIVDTTLLTISNKIFLERM